MTYPPPDHYLSDLGFRLQLGRERSSVLLEVDSNLCDGEGGGALLGVLATAIDMAAGSLSRRQAMPDWVATSDLAIELAAPIRPGPARVDCRLARRGRSLVTLDLELRGGHHEAAERRGMGFAAFAVLPSPGREQGGRRLENEEADGSTDGGAATALALPHPRGARAELPLYERLGIRVLDHAAGVVETPLADYVRNTFGALQGGVVAVLGEAAILAATGRPLSALAVRYLSLGRQGPFRTAAECCAETSSAISRAVLRDLGAGGAVVATAIGRSL